MAFKNRRLLGNIFVSDGPMEGVNRGPSGDHCFLIGHHPHPPRRLDSLARTLRKKGYRYFNIFGQEDLLWKEAILRSFSGEELPEIHTSKVAREEQAYALALLSQTRPSRINFVLSDDEFFTDYLMEDVQNILSGNAPFSLSDWQEFLHGYEFRYHGKDAILSLFSQGIVVGFLGKEKSYDSMWEAFQERVFDGRNFYDIWDELRNQRKEKE